MKPQPKLPQWVRTKCDKCGRHVYFTQAHFAESGHKPHNSCGGKLVPPAPPPAAVA